MNIINRRIMKIIFEMIITISIVGISIPVWNNSIGNTSYAKIADYYSSGSYKKLNIEKLQDMKLNNIAPMEDKKALNQEGTIIKITNGSNYNVSYKFYMKIDKDSTIDPETLKVSINNEIYYLQDKYTKETKNNYYYLLDNNEIQNNSEIYDIKLWISSETGNEMQNKTLAYDFVYEEDIKK